MPTEQAELSAEDVLLDAVLGRDASSMDEPQQRNGDLDQPDDLDSETEQEAEAEAEAGDKPETKAKTEETEAEEDYVEIAPAEEGGEPTKLKVSELVASHQAYQALRGQEAQILERVEREATERVTQHYAQVEMFAKQTAYHLQAAMQLLQPPRPPDANALLHPQSPQYNPDQYHMAFADYQRASQQFQAAQGVANELMQRAQYAESAATAQREQAELNKALRDWPDFGKPETQQEFVSDMGKAYGYSPQELDASLTDHRNLKVARDALAYRKLMAKGGDVKKAVEAKAPKLVRTKTEAKAGSAQARDQKGQFVQQSFKKASQSRSDDDWAQHFAALSKAGRF